VEEISIVNSFLAEPVERGTATMVAAVLMDVDGTLYYQPLLRLFMLGELLVSPLRLRSVHRVYKIVRIIREFRRVREELRCAVPQGVVLQECQFNMTAARVRVTEDEVKRTIDEWIFTRPLKYLRICRRRGLIAAVDALEAAGVTLGVFSDYPVADKLRAMGMERRFTAQLSATDPEINAFKPDPKGFLRACEILGVDPAEVVYVGDRPEVDAAGALAAGMPCVILSGRSPAARRSDLPPARWRSINSMRRLVDAVVDGV
jgi:HAD superfamily hydrolase (TIGR01549 family)